MCWRITFEEMDRDGSVLRLHTRRQVFATKGRAEHITRQILRGYHGGHGFDRDHHTWWGRDSEGRLVRIMIDERGAPDRVAARHRTLEEIQAI